MAVSCINSTFYYDAIAGKKFGAKILFVLDPKISRSPAEDHSMYAGTSTDDSTSRQFISANQI